MNNVQNRYKYIMTDRFGTIEVAPLNEGDFVVSYEQETEGKYFYAKQFQGKLIFRGDTYRRLKAIEESIYICTSQRMQIMRICNGTETVIFDGSFKLSEGDWDMDKCSVTLKFQKEKPDECFDKNKSVKINLLQHINNRVTVRTQTAGGAIEYKQCNTTIQQPSAQEYFCGTGTPDDGNWTLVDHYESSPDGVHYFLRNKWARELITLNAGESPESEWIHVSGTTWAKKVTLINIVVTSDYDDEAGTYTFKMRGDIAGYTGTATVIDNGMHLTDVLTLFKNQFCPTLEIKSDFFHINSNYGLNIVRGSGVPQSVNNGFIHYMLDEYLVGTFTVQIWFENTAPNSFSIYWGDAGWNYDTSDGVFDTAQNGVQTYTFTINKPTKNALMIWFNNQTTIKKIKLERGGVATGYVNGGQLLNYATGVASQVDDLILFQKSDVKRPNVSGNASKAEWTFEKLMETLNKMFNVYYVVENGIFRLEHISWFSRAQGMDLTLPKYEKYLKGLRRYSYDIDALPQKEIWMYKEQAGAGDNGEISYVNSCAPNGTDSTENYTVDELMVDVNFALSNPSSDSNKVDDSGFVLIATRKQGGQYYIISEGRMNSTLFFEKLLPNYHFHNRPINKGLFKGAEVYFHSTKPFKKGEKLSVPISCGEVFNPNDTVITPLGAGIVDTAKFNLRTCMLDLELKYNVFDNLTTNEPPIIIGDATHKTYKNQPITFPLNVSDPDGYVVAIQAVTQPASGTLEIIGTTHVRFTPENNFEGWVYFSLKAIDNWSQESTQANFALEVLPANTPPVAGNDYYSVFHGYAFTASPSIFANDTDDYGFTLITPNVTTAQGVSVSINVSTGIFSYTPPAGFEGIDTFQYTIQDNNGAQSTGTVFLTVGYKNKPIAVDDTYVTRNGVTLVTDGSLGKEYLWANDYTPDGLPYSYSCLVENKTTAQGGNVQINANGTFTYVPPAGFTGTDTFTYTVSNGNGTSTATVYVSVLPTIYVRLTRVNRGRTNVTIDCNGVQQSCGFTWKGDFKLSFFSDAAGTVPINVTGMNFKVNIQETQTISGGGGGGTSYSNTWETGVLGGTVHTLLEDFNYTEVFCSCGSSPITYNYSFALAAGAYVII